MFSEIWNLLSSGSAEQPADQSEDSSAERPAQLSATVPITQVTLDEQWPRDASLPNQRRLYQPC